MPHFISNLSGHPHFLPFSRPLQGYNTQKLESGQGPQRPLGKPTATNTARKIESTVSKESKETRERRNNQTPAPAPAPAPYHPHLYLTFNSSSSRNQILSPPTSFPRSHPFQPHTFVFNHTIPDTTHSFCSTPYDRHNYN